MDVGHRAFIEVIPYGSSPADINIEVSDAYRYCISITMNMWGPDTLSLVLFNYSFVNLESI